MNYISTNHQGGLCNTLFKLSAVISTAIDNNVEYLFSNEFVRVGYDPDYTKFKNNIYRNITFVDRLPHEYVIYNEKSFAFDNIHYQQNTNLLLCGYYQSEKYFVNNRSHIIKLFEPDENSKNLIISNFSDIQNSISIHVRRGDYLKLPNYHPQQPLDYYKQAVNIFGTENHYLIFSDDLTGIQDMFDFIPNKKFVSLGTDYLDLYAISLCKHNIICNSTFGWWGAYLNKNVNKKVVAPSYWFGPEASFNDTKDIIPENWIKL